MGSDERYYRRRLQQESEGARRAVTVEALVRRQSLVDVYRRKLAAIQTEGETFALGEVAA